MMFQFLTLAAQDPNGPMSQTEHPMWPYWVAISALSSAVVALFTLVVKQNRDFQEEIKEANAAHRAADDERSKRIAAEHERKDQKLYDLGTNSAVMMERIANSLQGLTNQVEKKQDG